MAAAGANDPVASRVGSHNLHRTNLRDRLLRDGLYKADFHTAHATGCGVIYVAGEKVRGGNSAFAFIGTWSRDGERIKVKVSTQRYNDDPAFKPLFGIDRVTLTLAGREDGDMLEFDGGALQLPGITFRAVLTRICD